mmetsp:Transcript_125607/g.355317  ORF Transcript_125607/g.355317 Transcript_125607/m.355317 type:complete len:214 (-) Transcript_125607:120-761(-)
MISFLGPAQAMAIAPLCTDTDLEAWVVAHRTFHAALMADAVWRQLLCAHFRPALLRVGKELGLPGELPEAVVKMLPEASRRIYADLRATTSKPFGLDPRARLVLEIHELRDWDVHQRQLVVQRQAHCIANVLRCAEAAKRLEESMAPDVLELACLKSLMGDPSEAPRLFDQSGMEWNPSVDLKFKALLDKKSMKRRLWWQRQREFLLEDLELH